jgi:hypothetical protein
MTNSDELKVFDAGDIEMPPPRQSDWGGWRREGLELVYGSGVYPVDLEGLNSSAVMLDLIMQVAKKNWATNTCLAGLVRALNDLLQPQAYLCSCGANKTLTPKQIRKMIPNHET